MIKSKFTIITFYQFKKIDDILIIKNELAHFCKFNKIKGTIILAEEGINGTIAGVSASIIKFESLLLSLGFSNINSKNSYSKFMPFFRLKVRNKKEIVTLRSKDVDTENITGKKIKPEDWNNLILDQETILIDVRNNFEVEMGTFKNSINPNTKSFIEFKSYIKNNLNKAKDKKIAMFCTGGIRCEKISSYMIKKGFKDVNQLHGGILSYLEKTSFENSLWNGECFVFDNRVSIKNELKDGSYVLCHACRYPLSQDMLKSKKYKKGTSCPNCYGQISELKEKSLKDRRKQITVAKKKGLYSPYIKLTVNDL
ncbi:rhodanese-related sulfurtransferase [Alphaproteobacteria bacterium]|nr:rhodanese-related sulfurtransferase [Alphaproteobacteria bacterium]MDC0453179.1 rhodanese-related sulfurtransferase [Alphaproteobacteria bacterium]